MSTAGGVRLRAWRRSAHDDALVVTEDRSHELFLAGFSRFGI
jgi:hypothetical protein